MMITVQSCGDQGGRERIFGRQKCANATSRHLTRRMCMATPIFACILTSSVRVIIVS
jgi:hypothetical protein